MYEVFLSYNSIDRSDVAKLAFKLRELGTSVWFDDWELVPGESWQRALSDGVAQSKSAALFIGPSGVGPWESAEAMLALNRAFREREYRVIPVLLPKAPATESVEMPPFLNLFSWVDFRQGLDDAEAFKRLIAGIKGEPPGPPESLPQHFLEPLRHNVDATALSECLGLLGISEDLRPGLVDWLMKECAESLGKGRTTRALSDLSDYLKRFDLPESTVVRTEGFLDEWITSLVPMRLLGSAFYLSVQKVARLYRAYRQAIEAHGRSHVLKPPADDSSEEKFLTIYRYFFDTGNIVFLPARSMLGQAPLWGQDPVFYFVGLFSLDLDEAFFQAFPDARDALIDKRRKAGIWLINDIFQHPDPLLYPFLSFSGQLGDVPVSMVMSRKYISLNSMTVYLLLRLLGGEPTVLSGFGSLEPAGERLYQVQPVACRVSGSHLWLEREDISEA